MGLSKQHLCMGRSECRLKFETEIGLNEIQRHVISMGSCRSSFSAFQRALAPSTCIRLLADARPSALLATIVTF